MKRLPCTTKACAKAGGAFWSPTEPAFIAVFPGKKYHCARCKAPQKITAAEFARLPEVPVETVPRATADLEGAGFTKGQAVDLLRAGIQDAHAVAELERSAE